MIRLLPPILLIGVTLLGLYNGDMVLSIMGGAATASGGYYYFNQ